MRFKALGLATLAAGMMVAPAMAQTPKPPLYQEQTPANARPTQPQGNPNSTNSEGRNSTSTGVGVTGGVNGNANTNGGVNGEAGAAQGSGAGGAGGASGAVGGGAGAGAGGSAGGAAGGAGNAN